MLEGCTSDLLLNSIDIGRLWITSTIQGTTGCHMGALDKKKRVRIHKSAVRRGDIIGFCIAILGVSLEPEFHRYGCFPGVVRSLLRV